MRDDSTDTIRLTELFFARDEEALRETARLYEPLCMHIALNILADRQDAEECVNDTWLRAWNHIPPDRPRSMAAYLVPWHDSAQSCHQPLACPAEPGAYG